MAPATEERQEHGGSIGHVRSNPEGWRQYYGRFHGSALKPVWQSMNLFLTRWLMQRYKGLAGHKTRAAEMLQRLAQRQPGAFAHRSLRFVS